MRHKSARGRRRFHTDRVIRNRQRRYLRVTPSWALRDPLLADGRLADTDRYFDCGNPRCGICHWTKFNEPRRAREKREWQRVELDQANQIA